MAYLWHSWQAGEFGSVTQLMHWPQLLIHSWASAEVQSACRHSANSRQTRQISQPLHPAAPSRCKDGIRAWQRTVCLGSKEIVGRKRVCADGIAIWQTQLSTPGFSHLQQLTGIRVRTSHTLLALLQAGNGSLRCAVGDSSDGFCPK